MYPNSSDLTFLEKVNTIYGEEDEYGNLIIINLLLLLLLLLIN